jgi:hypothetical protein
MMFMGMLVCTHVCSHMMFMGMLVCKKNDNLVKDSGIRTFDKLPQECAATMHWSISKATAWCVS